MRVLCLALLLPLLSACPEPEPPVDPESDAGPPEEPQAAEVALLFGETTTGVADGQGRGARFDSVTCLELSPDGSTLYASDTFVGTLRAIDVESREVTTLAGVPFEASTSDGVGDEVRLTEPRGLGMTPDAATLYVMDGPVLRSVDLATSEVVSLSGLASEPGYVDGSSVEARHGFLNHDLEVLADGRVLLADRSNNVLRAYQPDDETVDTFATSFNGPGGLSRDGETLYVADTFAGALRRVDVTNGAVELVVSGLDAPQGVAFDGEDSLYALGFDGALRRFELSSETLSDVTTDPRIVDGSFASPVIDRARGRLYFPELSTSAIQVVELSTGERWTLAGPERPSGFLDGSFEDARFGFIYGLAATSDGSRVYVADSDNGAIRVVDMDAEIVQRVVDDAWTAPVGVALDEESGVLYVSDADAGTITRIELEAGTVTEVASDLAMPWGLVFADGALFVAELGANALVRVDPDSGAREVWVDGVGGANGVAAIDDVVYVSSYSAGTVTRVQTDGEGIAVVASGLAAPSGLAGHDGRLLVAVSGDHTLRSINPQTGEVELALGRPGVEAAVGTAGVPADEATLRAPEAIAVTPDGVLVAVEYGAYRVPFEALP